jgi:predicted small lipoprotein YifL
VKRALLLAAVLSLAACGKAAPLKPAAGESLPVAPYGAATPPTADNLLTPAPEARPDRQDELLRRSEERKSDEFDLPPE